MKAIRVPQPEAWLISNGHLHLLNRPRNIQFRGRVLIYADSAWGDDEEEAYEFYTANLPGVTIPEFFDQGGIVGEAYVDDCIGADESPLFKGPFALVFRHPKPTTYFRCRDEGFLFDVKDVDLPHIGIRN